MTKEFGHPDLRCSFCGKTQREVEKLFAKLEQAIEDCVEVQP